MNLAQTNLQLYRQLMAAGWQPGELATTRAAYDLARELFVGCHRPTHKDFSAHLIGVASALAHWSQPAERVWAGLLHSAYLYGDFGDGTRGATDEKRARVRAVIGDRAEGLVFDYGQLEGVSIDEIDEEAIVIMRLADLADECVDGGVAFAPEKGLPMGALSDDAGREQLLAIADRELSAEAAEQLRALVEETAAAEIPRPLQTADRAFTRTIEHEPGLRQRAEDGVRRLVGKVRRRLG